VDAIEPGADFAKEISRAVAACTVLLAIIGPAWLTAADERGRRRLHDPGDLVRLEIEAALARGVRVIPILVEGAVMPARENLPESLADLSRRNALWIRHESFRSDAGRLVAAIERVLAAPGTTTFRRASGARSGATRLFSLAERTANSVTDQSRKATALGWIATALAATHPDRAERIANSITDQPWKAVALSNVAKALAATSS
jgi:hypothetical protein